MSEAACAHPVPDGLRVEVRRNDGGVRVELHGELDITTTAPFESAMRSLAYQYDAGQITVDLADLDFIDLRGTYALKRAARMCEPNGRIRLRGEAPNLDLLLNALGSRDLFVLER